MQLLGGGILQGQSGIQAIAHWQQAFGKAFNAKFARLGHAFFGTAAHVFRIGFGPQELVGQIGIFWF